MALGLALACAAGAEAAMAQVFFQPFVHTFRYDLPPDDDDFDDRPRFASRRAVARILAREGFQLVGPLGRRGEQIVATGVSRREGETRFFIDPFDGVILHAVSLGPPPPEPDRPRREDDRFIPQLGGSHPVVKEIGRDRAIAEEPRSGDRSRRMARRAPDREPQSAPRPEAREAVAPPAANPAPVATPAPRIRPAKPVETAKPAPAPKPTEAPKTIEAAKPIEWAKPAEIAKPAAEAAKPAQAQAPAEEQKKIQTARPAEQARPATPAKPSEAARPLAAKPAEASKPVAPPVTEAAKTAPAPVATAPKAPAVPPRATAARSTSGAGRRAIVPPGVAEGTTVVTPSTPATSTAHSPGGARTPQSVAMPKSE
jgi:hypothetical protein